MTARETSPPDASRSRLPQRLVSLASLTALLLAVSGCGSSSTHKPHAAIVAADDPHGRISVAYEPALTADARFAKEILQLGGTNGIASGLTHSFKLPTSLEIHVVKASVGPHYDPQTKTITLSYPFVNYTAGVLAQNFPGLRRDQREFGRELAAVDGFILMHEFGHALIDVFSLPVLGKEEDAADSVATVFLTTSVKNGAQYAFDAAKFFHGLSTRQRKHAPSAYWDEHSLDEQRAFSIVCWIAGSSQENFQSISKLQLLGRARLQSCPAEYQQKVHSWATLLSSHVRA